MQVKKNNRHMGSCEGSKTIGHYYQPKHNPNNALLVEHPSKLVSSFQKHGYHWPIPVDLNVAGWAKVDFTWLEVIPHPFQIVGYPESPQPATIYQHLRNISFFGEGEGGVLGGFQFDFQTLDFPTYLGCNPKLWHLKKNRPQKTAVHQPQLT